MKSENGKEEERNRKEGFRKRIKWKLKMQLVNKGGRKEKDGGRNKGSKEGRMDG